jgi:formiminoglutamase
MYQPTSKGIWTGRTDEPDEEAGARWHQVIEMTGLTPHIKQVTKGIAFLGFCCDTGVERNKGRKGAAAGPDEIRRALSNMAWHFRNEIKMIDAGTIFCIDDQLEAAQEELGSYVSKLLNAGYFPVLVGGGHEIAYGHYLGISSFLKKHNTAIINFDAHFDLRKPYSGGNSGTPFYQIAGLYRNNNLPFPYLAIGIQEHSNTQALFDTARELGTEWIAADGVNLFNLKELKEKLDQFMENQQHIYLSLCLDVFSASHAPGVSAINPAGINPDVVIELYRHIFKSGKVISLDVAELNPLYDIDGRTAKLAAVIIYKALDALMRINDKGNNWNNLD